MLKMYNTDLETNVTTETKEFKKGNWINMVSPSEDEIKKVIRIYLSSENDENGTSLLYRGVG